MQHYIALHIPGLDTITPGSTPVRLMSDDLAMIHSGKLPTLLKRQRESDIYFDREYVDDALVTTQTAWTLCHSQMYTQTALDYERVSVSIGNACNFISDAQDCIRNSERIHEGIAYEAFGHAIDHIKVAIGETIKCHDLLGMYRQREVSISPEHALKSHTASLDSLHSVFPQMGLSFKADYLSVVSLTTVAVMLKRISDSLVKESSTFTGLCGRQMKYIVDTNTQGYVGLYEKCREYGGPEEGGWWVTTHRHIASVSKDATCEESRHEIIAEIKGWFSSNDVVLLNEAYPGDCHDLEVPPYS